MSPSASTSKQVCGVCEKEAKSRCGGCKRIPFCSAECQELVGRLTDLRCSPVNPHLSLLRSGRRTKRCLRTTQRSAQPSTLMQEARKYYGRGFSEETLGAILTTPAPPETSDSSIWGQREHLLRLAREVLDAAYVESTGGHRDHLNDPRQRNPWQEFQPVLLECAASLQTDPRDKKRSPAEVSLQMMRLFNSFLRQAIMYINLQMDVIQEHDERKGPELLLTTIAAGRRLKKVFEEDVLQKPGTPMAVPLIIGMLVEKLTANFEALEQHIAR